MRSDLDAAEALYRDGKLLLDATRDAAVSNDELRRVRKDAEEDLLDLRLAIIEGNVRASPEHIDDVQRTILVIRQIIAPSARRGGQERA